MSIIGALAVSNSAIWFLFSKAETLITPEVRGTISNWLLNLNKEGETANWNTTFAKMFDNIFSNKPFSLQCVIRSCIASFVAVFILIFLWWAIHPEAVYGFVRSNKLYEVILIPLAISISFNLITDYVSLLETRYIIRKLKDTKSSTKIFGYLIIDFVATVFIYLTVMALMLFIFFLILSIFYYEDFISRKGFLNDYLAQYLFLLKELYYGITLSSSSNPTPDITIGVWFYSTFFTSIWIYLYVISGLIVKLGVKSGILVGRIGEIFNVSEKPLRVMGYICIIFVSIIFLIASFVNSLFY